ncbi:hypothetical protein ACFOOP_10265 [Marinicaulis aureus]|uniref:Phage terminase small subunit P27 family n=1 Tax=Hyphococcus aureus TaxID=2666033 RepID=A0ABW1L0A7_9PROT
MGARGKKSASELNVVSINAMPPRPEPPPFLNIEQAEEWRAVVKRMPQDWFKRETWALLESFCRHVCMARRIAEQIDRVLDEPTVKTASFDKLLRMQARESASIVQLATKMRLAQQSSYCAKTAATAKDQRGSTHLWDDPEDPAREFLD